MKYQYTVEKEVVPFIFDDSSSKNAEKIGLLVKNFGGLKIISYAKNQGKLLILVEGNIGNRIDRLIRELKCFCVADEIQAREMLNYKGTCCEFSELNESLLSIYE